MTNIIKNFIALPKYNLIKQIFRKNFTSNRRFYYKNQTESSLFSHNEVHCSNFISKKKFYNTNLKFSFLLTRFKPCSHSKDNFSYYPLLGFSFFGYELFEDDEETEEDVLEMTVKRGILAMRRDQLDKAEQLYHLALKMATEKQDQKAITFIYDMMANLAFQREQFEKAEKLFKSVIQRLLGDGTPENDNAIIEISLKLASIYASTEQVENAILGFHFCIATQDKKIKELGVEQTDEDTLILWAMGMDWYARFLIRLGKFDLAKEYFIKAYEMCIKVNGTDHEQTAVLLNDIGSVCSMMKNYEEALDYMNKAISVAEKIESEDTATFYVNLGMIQMKRELFNEASNLCKKAAKLAKDAENEAILCEAEDCLEQALALKKESLKSKEQ